jgi:DNA-binding MarR family transcriptional regulator
MSRDVVSGVFQLANLLTRRLAPVLEKASVTPQQWAVLVALADHDEPMSLAAIGRSMMVSKQNMTGMIARLEQLGLVERGEHPTDLRSSPVRLTRRGRQLLDKYLPVYEQWIATLGGMSERDLRAFERTITQLIEHLES